MNTADGRKMIALLAFFLTVAEAGSASAAEKPNVVVIMADDLGYGDLSCYDGWIRTPAIDSIARHGLRMTDYHSNGNVCSPTRAALLTGCYQQRIGIPFVVVADPSNERHFAGMQATEWTLAEAMRRRGYATGIFGKWHLGYFEKYNPENHGFDQFIGYVSGNVDFHSHIDQAGKRDWWHGKQLTEEQGYTTHLITEHAVRFIHANRRRPFFLYVPHEAPHYPYQGPNDGADRTVGGDFDNHGSRTDKKDAYREMVEEMDRGVGAILKALKANALLDNTIVLFCSDNGATVLGSNGHLRGTKGTNFEGGHRVPCVVQWPGRIAAGSQSGQLALAMDLMPTILDCAGRSTSRGRAMDGISLKDHWLGASPAENRTVIWNGNTVRTGTWKLMEPQRKLQSAALFHLGEDPSESTNRIAEFPEMASALRAKLENWKADMKATATGQPTQ